MIIGSGSKCNIINDTIWNRMKSNKIKIVSQIRNAEKMLMTYGYTNPVEVLGSLKTNFTVGAKTETTKLQVVKDD